MAVHDIIKRNKALDESLLHQMTPKQLMTELTKAVLKVWPEDWVLRQGIGEELKSLAEIAAMLNPEAINEFVRVRASECVIVDARRPLKDFKDDLWQHVFAEPL